MLLPVQYIIISTAVYYYYISDYCWCPVYHIFTATVVTFKAYLYFYFKDNILGSYSHFDNIKRTIGNILLITVKNLH